MQKIKIGVMGSAGKDNSKVGEEAKKLAFEVGKAIAEKDCILLNGACPGLPEEAAKGAKSKNGFTVGISPGHNLKEHKELYKMPDEALDVIIFTGFGFKGRNVITIRASDAIITIGGGIGTLNEFTIAFDEGKVIGVLEGSGGISDELKDIIEKCGKTTSGRVIFEKEPKALVEKVLQTVKERLE